MLFTDSGDIQSDFYNFHVEVVSSNLGPIGIRSHWGLLNGLLHILLLKIDFSSTVPEFHEVEAQLPELNSDLHDTRSKHKDSSCLLSLAVRESHPCPLSRRLHRVDDQLALKKQT